MKLYRTISGVILFFSSSVFAQVVLNTKAEKALSEIMKAQEFYWNKGDIEGFMEGYWNNAELVFVGKNGPTYGSQNTLENYKKDYPYNPASKRIDFSQ
jgi:hypothetical protein